MEDTELAQICGRITAHDFLIEILYARDWADFSHDEAVAGKDKIVDLLRYRSRAPKHAGPKYGDEFLFAVQAEAVASAEKLLTDALERSSEIRRSQDQMSQPRPPGGASNP